MVSQRKAIESLYKGLCDIYNFVSEKDEKTGRIKNSREVKINDEQIPCRLSFSTLGLTNQEDGGRLNQVIKLFLNPEIEIKPNSKIVVWQNGRMNVYTNSSVPAVYSNHQEVVLTILDKWG